MITERGFGSGAAIRRGDRHHRGSVAGFGWVAGGCQQDAEGKGRGSDRHWGGQDSGPGDETGGRMRPTTTRTSGQVGGPSSVVPEQILKPHRECDFYKGTGPISALRGFPAALEARMCESASRPCL